MSVFAYLEDRDSGSRATTLSRYQALPRFSLWNLPSKHKADHRRGNGPVPSNLGSQYIKDTKRDRLQDIKNWKKTSTKSPASMRGYLVAVPGFLQEE